MYGYGKPDEMDAVLHECTGAGVWDIRAAGIKSDKFSSWQTKVKKALFSLVSMVMKEGLT